MKPENTTWSKPGRLYSRGSTATPQTIGPCILTRRYKGRTLQVEVLDREEERRELEERLVSILPAFARPPMISE